LRVAEKGAVRPLAHCRALRNGEGCRSRRRRGKERLAWPNARAARRRRARRGKRGQPEVRCHCDGLFVAAKPDGV
jgi:hypothetical protein